MDSACLFTDKAWLEKNFGAAESFIPDSDDVPIRELVSFFLVGAFSSVLHLSIKVKGNVAELLLDISHNLTLCCGSEGVATFCEDLHQILREIPACQVKA